MSKNEIGKYVRTEDGYILENIWGGHADIIKKLANKDKHYEFEYGKIVKHSNSLIELIEVGDYINGEKILEIILPDEEIITKDTEDKVITVCIFKNGNGAYYKYISEAKIENMLTHERYYQTCYEPRN